MWYHIHAFIHNRLVLVVKPFGRQDFIVYFFPGLSNKHGQEKQRRHLEKRCDERKKHDKKKNKEDTWQCWQKRDKMKKMKEKIRWR